MLHSLKGFIEKIQSFKERDIEEEQFNGYGFMRRVYGVEEMPHFQTILKLSRTDTLTQTLNRLAFDDLIEREIDVARRYGSKLSLVLLNINYFSRINQQFNHLASDQLLREFADFLNNSIRKADILFRWSGDEFLIIMIHTDNQMAEQFADSITAKIAAHHFNSIGQFITSSVGYAEIALNENIDDVLVRLSQSYQHARKLRSIDIRYTAKNSN
ncbi:MAG: GGDEF domain-containing protein [Gammaproteobacteria bacterium]|nr:GGDEF domain-containing protein [Gammaproteobacteria bacterium]